MNIFYNIRLEIFYTLNDNVNNDKLIKSIKLLNKKNKIFIMEKYNPKYSFNNQIYISIENKKLIFNFNHLYYDGYSTYLILQKIDDIYRGEITHFKFDFYDFEFDLVKYYYNNIKILSKINYKHIYDSFIIKKNKKTIKILKNKLNPISTKEIIYYLLNKLKIEKYCLLVNMRSIFKNYENVLGNLVYVSNSINKNQEIRPMLEQDANISMEKLSNNIPNTILVNSFLNFILPSIITSFSINTNVFNINVFGNHIIIYPLNTDKEYIIVDYCY